jgi:tryptophan-rich sensory protein
MVVLNISAIAAAYKFYQINEHAGLMMVPYALWTGFYALLSYSMYNNVNNHPIN